ncbi:protein TESPA1 isoform X1 [Polypterus senegalus]|nr:protein TESPA1 isoform X1 [Polypterus senegalus]
MQDHEATVSRTSYGLHKHAMRSMGDLSLTSPSPKEKRQAWIQRSRHWFTVKDELEDPLTSELQPDDVFFEEPALSKTEQWVQKHSSRVSRDLFPEDLKRLSVESFSTLGASWEDNFSLGAEATDLLNNQDVHTSSHCSLLPPPRSRLRDSIDEEKTLPGLQERMMYLKPMAQLGHSMASSGLTWATNNTIPSVSEVLDMCMEDAEQVLFNLGFGQEEPQFTSRIPPRFFDFPSKLKGINFRLFLESQLCRLKEEDPSLSLASRFHQVEVLTATANAFYSLYSYVSKTPIQKLAPPEFSFSSPTEKISQRFSVRSEPRSPVERFKDTISKMCLYTKEPGSPAASPRSTPQKRHSLPSLIESVHDSTKVGLSMTMQMNWSQETLKADDLCGGHREQSSTLGSPCLLKPTEVKMPVSLDSPGEQSNLPTELHPKPVRFTRDMISPRITEKVYREIFNVTKKTARSSGPTEYLTLQAHEGEALVSPEINCISNMCGATLCRDAEELPATKVNKAYSSNMHGLNLQITSWSSADENVQDIHTHRTCIQNVAVMETSEGPMDILSNKRFAEKQTSLSPGEILHRRGCWTHQALKQESSFEMEEIQSAGEEESSLLETRNLMTSTPVSVMKHPRALYLRGDSMQSDSSGFVEDEFQNQTLPIAPDE